MRNHKARSEHAVFEELAELCTNPGYVHAIAYFCYRDNMIGLSEEMTEDDMVASYSPTRLIRTEISTLIGLMVKAEVNYVLPAPSAMQHYITETERLLEELHFSMSQAMWQPFAEGSIADSAIDPFESGEALREPIFYGGESAYDFQYRDLATLKYAADNPWLESHKGFSIDVAEKVIHALKKIQSEQISETLNSFKGLPSDDWTILPGFIFDVANVSIAAGLDAELVTRVLNAFTTPVAERNLEFKALHDFNIVNATPLLYTQDGRYLALQAYSLSEALYESPFFWMGLDKAYVPTLMENRGRFTESFVHDRLMQVFGKGRVFANVDIVATKSTKIGEVDVLVIFGDRAIVVQAKSKRLTLAARKGNDQAIRDDFKKSVQDAYDQAVLCASCLEDSRYALKLSTGEEIVLTHALKEIYIFCVVSDHYPALSFQARQFLRTETKEKILPPLVMDVFAVDTMAEMLGSPLQFLSYVNRRAKYADKVHAMHELTILGYHLKRNLWLDDDKMSMVSLEDGLSAGLDVAMTVRREGVRGNPVPDGILSRLTNTMVGQIIREIEGHTDPALIDLGFMLLALSEDSVKNISKGVARIAALSRRDGESHDFTLCFDRAGFGLTIHCNNDPIEIASTRLMSHCKRRKYVGKASTWFGLCISPREETLRFGLNLSFQWKQSDVMDVQTQGMAGAPIGTAVAAAIASAHPKKTSKIGRNDRCPCGSGLKYKKCCLS